MHLQRGGQHAVDLAALHIGRAGQIQRQFAFAPRLPIARSQLKVVQLQLAVGSHLIVFGMLPANVPVDAAGQLVAGQVDEPAGIGSQLAEIAAYDGRSLAQRALGRHVQEAGAAGQFVDDRAGGRAAQVGRHQDRFLPGEFLPVFHGGQIGGFQSGRQSRRIAGFALQRQVEQSRLDLRCLPQIQRCRQHFR